MQKHHLKLMVLAPLAISPLVAIASCSSTNPNQDQEAIASELAQLAANATFSVANKNQLASEVSLTEIKWDQNGANPGVKLVVLETLANDSSTSLGFKAKFQKGQYSHSFTIAPDSTQAIRGFAQLAPVTPDVQKEIENEVARLNRYNWSQALSQTSFSQDEVLQWQVAPNRLLSLLKSDVLLKAFSYNVLNLNITQTQAATSKPFNLSFNIEVSKRVAYSLQTNVLTVPIQVRVDDSLVQPPSHISAPLAQAREQARLDRMQAQLIQSRFSFEEINRIIQTPNLLMQKLLGFVPMQYWQYQVQALKINNQAPQQVTQAGQYTISFKVVGKLYRGVQPGTLTTAQTKLLSFTVAIYDPNADTEVKPPQWDQDYSIDLRPEFKPDETIKLDFQQNQKVNLFHLLDENKQVNYLLAYPLLYYILEHHADQMFQIKNLPATWDWEQYFQIGDSELIYSTPNDASTQPAGIDFTFYIYYPTSESTKPGAPDDQLIANLRLENMFYDDSKPLPQPDIPAQFQAIVVDFQKQINQLPGGLKLNEDQLHAGFNDVFQFANLSESNPNRSVLNYLNFDVGAFNKKHIRNASLRAQDVRINYLTNQIQWRWTIVGHGTMAAEQWADTNWTTLTYQPSGAFSDSREGDELKLDAGFVSLAGKLDKFQANPNFVSKAHQEELLNSFGANWTWKARELLSSARLVLAQAYGDAFERINYGLKITGSDLGAMDQLQTNPQSYQIQLKAKLKFASGQTSQTFVPFYAPLGNLADQTPYTFTNGEIITLNFDVDSVLQTPSLFTAAAEIMPGFGVGETWGIGFGDAQVQAAIPFRTDVFNNQVATYHFSAYKNDLLIKSFKNVHRGLAMNLFNRYRFKDAFWSEPTDPTWWSAPDGTKPL